MTRATIRIATLIAMFVGLFASFNTVKASESTVHNVFVTDFRDGQFIAALQNQDESYTAITFNAVNQTTFEDMFPASGNMITATLDLNAGMMTAYSTEYGMMIDLAYTEYTDDHHTIGYVETNNGITYGQLDGDYAQFRGIVVNGTAIKLRSANAYSVNGIGYLLQNGNLISYTVSNNEARVYIVNLPLVLR